MCECGGHCSKTPSSRREKVYNWLYLAGTGAVHYGATLQIIKLFTTKSAEDLSLWWMVFLFLGHSLHLPRSVSSRFGVWKLNCLLGMSLIAVMIIGILLYG